MQSRWIENGEKKSIVGGMTHTFEVLPDDTLPLNDMNWNWHTLDCWLWRKQRTKVRKISRKPMERLGLVSMLVELEIGPTS